MRASHSPALAGTNRSERLGVHAWDAPLFVAISCTPQPVTCALIALALSPLTVLGAATTGLPVIDSTVFDGQTAGGARDYSTRAAARRHARRDQR